ncbi:MAG: FtsH protease activity modulator HflK [Rhodospirillaceae bacterium]|nr:FtsH protease activity modulator HflK [Rhodospirillaceae bacterium]
MSWKPQGGGPWGGGGQGPWGGGSGNSGGPTPPDIEEMLRRSQDRFKSFIPGGFGSGRGIILALIAALAIWLGSGFYRVQPGEQGVELLFGEFIKQTPPGLNYWAPSPIGTIYRPNVEKTNTINVGFQGAADNSRSNVARDVPLESLMLTGDQNIIDIDFVVQWRIKNAADFLFNIRDPEATIKVAAESAMREVIGRTTLEEALTVKRQQVQIETKALLQEILDGYGAGVAIAEIQLQKVDPPRDVIDSFNDVQRAKQDQERSINEATAYRNGIVPRAQGTAQKMLADSSAYKERLIKEADGEAKRFLAVYETYRVAKDVTRQRMYLEQLEEVLKNSDKLIIDSSGAGGVVPYLAIPELLKRDKGASQ